MFVCRSDPGRSTRDTTDCHSRRCQTCFDTGVVSPFCGDHIDLDTSFTEVQDLVENKRFVQIGESFDPDRNTHLSVIYLLTGGWVRRSHAEFAVHRRICATATERLT